MHASEITFAIPTWNRSKQLEVCIRSIAEQGGLVMVSDHASTDGTKEVINKLCTEFSTIRTQHVERLDGGDFQDNFRATFGNAYLTPWTWMFGDDDILLPNALETVLGTLEGLDIEFLRVAEKVRASPSPSFKRGSLLEICNTFGWLDMTGFITGNIVKTERLNKAVNNPHWDQWSKNAFPQSCALLEELHDAKSMFLDLPLIDSQPKPPEDAKRWEANRTAERYFYVDESLQDMVDRGTLEWPLDNVFFRYHSYFLWDRLISNMITDYYSFPDAPHVELWEHIKGLARLLSKDQQQILMTRIAEVQGVLSEHYGKMKDLRKWTEILEQVNAQHNTERFSWTYRPVDIST